jgi:GTP-binding protein
MKIKTAEFVVSNSRVDQCPADKMPEFGFIGRSNVGKSSLINMLVQQKNLAKTSSTPGKTKLLNHFIINNEWYLVDLPGYGYAKTSKTDRKIFSQLVSRYISDRENLISLFLLIDSRHKPLKADLEFIHWLGSNHVPFNLVFTKSDKISSSVLESNMAAFKKELMKTWENLPLMIVTSSKSGLGRDEILDFISQTLSSLKV